MSEFIIRKYEKGDEVKINEAFNQIFNQNRSIKEWFWKFEPEKNKYRIIVAVDKESNIMAHYAAVTVPMIINGQNIVGAQNLDSFALDRPEVLKRRLFIKTALKFIKDYGESLDIPYFYGSNSGKILELGKLLFKYTDGVPITFLYKDTKRYQRVLGRFIRNRVWQWFARQVPFKIEELNELWKRSQPRYNVSVVKDGNYIEHRYLNHPSRKYIYITSRRRSMIEALAILKYDVGKLHWVDLVWDGNSAKSLVSLERNIWHLALLLGAVNIEMWLNNDEEAKELLMACGMKTKQNPYDLYITSRSFSKDFEGEDVTRRLYFTMGDTDMF